MMLDKLKSLGITNQIQQQAVRILADSYRGYMRSDLFRLGLIESLASVGSGAVYVAKINSEVEALVEQKMLLRQVRHSEHEIGLNKVVWSLSSETIRLICEATTSATESQVFEPDFSHLVREVKKQLRQIGGARERVSGTGLEMLIARFRPKSAIG
jgi:hypothetical protein